MAQTSTPACNAFTVDFEDWYQGIELPFDSWKNYKSRIEIGLYKVLDLLSAHKVRGTFFTLGWIAEKYPHLIKEVAARGHELGSHGYSHEKVYNLTPDQFRDEVVRTKKAIEDLTGQPLLTYRAPFFSVTEKSLWALGILAETGHTIDCSISPVKTWRYGIAACPDEIFNISDYGITEFPVSTFNFLSKRWAIGGAYFRLLPYMLTRKAFNQRLDEQKFTMFYIHPWEYDPEHPVEKIEWKAKITHYTNLTKTVPNTDKMLGQFQFDTVSNIVKNYAADRKISTLTADILKG